MLQVFHGVDVNVKLTRASRTALAWAMFQCTQNIQQQDAECEASPSPVPWRAQT